MDSLPSEYKDLELTKVEKILVRTVLSQDQYGFIIIKANPSMMDGDSMHVLITKQGVLMIKTLEVINEASIFELAMKAYISSIHTKSADFISKKLLNNKSLVDADGNIKFRFNIIYLFSEFDRAAAEKNTVSEEIKRFLADNCLFVEEISYIRNNFEDFLKKYLSKTIIPVSGDKIDINDFTINSIIQRIAPEYVTVRISSLNITASSEPGVSEELLVVNENDDVVKAYRLDKDQINIVNKINKGEKLILACAGSGKSVLLISKCFKAASMNPNKKFLITCFNKNLQSLYTWFIDIAGLRAKNVQCMTFHKLCKTLLIESGYKHIGDKPDEWINMAITLMEKNSFSTKYYGIFIDEVQEFDTEWYKFCYNLLENKDSDEHIFVICGDKTQKIKNKQKHGKAPWNAGEGYPNYRNKSIHIEKNYRNCIEINEYINKYVILAKEYLSLINPEETIDPDMFLRGQSVYHGNKVKITRILDNTTNYEIEAIISAIQKVHDKKKLPYDEIAVIMNLGQYPFIRSGWKNKKYCLEYFLTKKLDELNIPYCKMYNSDTSWAEHYGESGGVKLLKADSVLGLDFRAAIVCGLITLGEHNQSKDIDWNKHYDDDKRDLLIKDTQDCIRRLYVACTRAKEYLEIILPHTSAKSIYCDLLNRASKAEV
jgi:hypothetical protein